ncbi:MAG: hypothetical protein H7Y19_09505 [Luteimonas sp.]|nr:hypothetical protein [Luteimonas sp.]
MTALLEDRDGALWAGTTDRGLYRIHRGQVRLSSLRLRIRDDGSGMDITSPKGGSRPGHWGLQGMGERATEIGAASISGAARGRQRDRTHRSRGCRLCRTVAPVPLAQSAVRGGSQPALAAPNLARRRPAGDIDGACAIGRCERVPRCGESIPS